MAAVSEPVKSGGEGVVPSPHRPSLFDPIRLGAIEAPNRILMAPMTRGRATRDHVPTALMAEHYAQRASAGLIVSEATGVSAEGLGWPCAPGIFTSEQVRGWAEVTERVHRAGGRIVLQLWHMGRLAHPHVTGIQPVSASATTAVGYAYTYEAKEPYADARALEKSEIPGVVTQFRRAAQNAMSAGFDGVQVHAANGYLIDQFLRDSSNFRDDEYGGSIPNRMRLLLQITEEVANLVGADRTSVRLSPNGESKGVDDSDQDALFTAVAGELSPLSLGFLELRDVAAHGTFGSSERLQVAPLIRRAYDGPLVLNSDYTQTTGQHMLDTRLADAISWGRAFLANPDLPARMAAGLDLTDGDQRALWFTNGPEGYTDYPRASTPEPAQEPAAG